jgi:hypothetical protein
VEGVVRVDNQLTRDLDDIDDLACRAAYSWLGP